MALFDAHSLDTNLYFLHRGIIHPKSGIGHHFHNQCEEMFVIFDGEAQFTIDGRTSTFKGPAGAPCRMGHSHAIYNPTDKPVQWMNINVSAMKGAYDAFDLGDRGSTCRWIPIPVFMTMRLDRALLRPVPDEWRQGYCAIPARARAQRYSPDRGRMWTTWCCLRASRAGLTPSGVAEFYYVMNGEGTVTVARRKPRRCAAATRSRFSSETCIPSRTRRPAVGVHDRRRVPR